MVLLVDQSVEPFSRLAVAMTNLLVQVINLKPADVSDSLIFNKISRKKNLRKLFLLFIFCLLKVVEMCLHDI